MTRVKINTLERFAFSTERLIGISDVNYARHLDSVGMVKILHEARLQFLADLGFTESNIYGLGMVVADLAMDCRSQSFANDRLIVDVGIGDFNRYGCDIVFNVDNSALDSKVCNAKMGIVFFDFDKNSIAEVPGAFKSVLKKYEEQVA